MLFKNLVFHRLPAEWTLTAAELEAQLAGRTLQACGPFEMSCRGWVPVTAGGRLLHTVNRQHMIALGENQKLLPGSIIRQVAAGARRNTGRGAGLSGRAQANARTAGPRRGRAACASAHAAPDHAGLDRPLVGLVRRGRGRHTGAESVVEALSDTLGSFAPLALETERSPHAAMASWLMRGEAPARFSIDDDLELQTADKSKTIIRYTRHPLDGKEIQAHLASGKYPTRLGLTWNDRVSFVLTDKLQIKRLEFLEMSKELRGRGGSGPGGTVRHRFCGDGRGTRGTAQGPAQVLGTSDGAADWPARSKSQSRPELLSRTRCEGSRTRPSSWECRRFR